MLSLISQSEISFDEDVYIARVRGPYHQLIANSGYRGIKIIDCLGGQVIKDIPFPNPSEDFLTETWLVSPDGSESYLFSRDEESFAIEVDHKASASRRIKLPSDFKSPTGLCWFSPNLHMYGQFSYWVLQGSQIIAVGDAGTADYGTDMLKSINEKLDGLGVLKMDALNEGMYVSDFHRTGYVPLGESPSLLTAYDERIIDLTHYGEFLFACSEDGINLWHDGKNERLLDAYPDEHFMSVNMIKSAKTGFLCVLSARQDRTASSLRVFQLSVSENSSIHGSKR